MFGFSRIHVGPVIAGGELKFIRDYQSNVFYYFADQVGSSRGMFEVLAGSHTASPPCFDADFYPFGGEHDFINTCPQNYKFMGKERDPETNNDDFGARSYASAYGRFLSADWSSTPTPVPYANLANPQTLNLYAMVSDNPESFADLDGHDCFNHGATDSASCPGQGQGSASSGAPTPGTAQNQSPYQRYMAEQNRPTTDQDKLNMFKQAGTMADAGVKAGLVVVGAEGAVAAAVVAAPAVASSSVASTATTTLSNAATTVATAATSAGAAVANAYQAVGNQIMKAAVQIDTLKPGGGAVKAATDFVQGVTSRTSPVTNSYNMAGRALRLSYEAVKSFF